MALASRVRTDREPTLAQAVPGITVQVVLVERVAQALAVQVRPARTAQAAVAAQAIQAAPRSSRAALAAIPVAVAVVRTARAMAASAAWPVAARSALPILRS
jgi:hypothetical protein